MKNRSEPPNGLDLPEFWRRLDDLEAGVLEEPQCAALAAMLEQSPAARRAYLEFFQQSAVLRMEAAKLHERGLLPLAGSADQTRRAVRLSLLAAAALVAMGVLIAALVVVTRPEPARLSAAVAADTRWSIDGVKQGSGDEPVSVVEGSSLRVLSGTVKLELESGDLLVVQGPADVSFPSLHRPRLRHGWLWIDAGKSTAPFLIETPGLKIRDIGTRFGVRVADDGMVEVHLVSGKVEVLATGGKTRAVLDEAGKGHAFATDGGMAEIPSATDPFPSLPGLLRQPANYQTTVLGQSPVGYWPLDDGLGAELGNKIGGSSAGLPGQAVRAGEPGPSADGGFAGFAATGRSLYLDGSKDRSAVVGIDGLNGVSRREGAVSFWIRRPAGAPPRDEMLWLAGLGTEKSPSPSEAILHTGLTASGHVVFEIENGNDDVFLSSSRNIADGSWHQIVASWGPTSVDLFIDGRLVARDSGKRVLKEGSFRGRYVRFGKPSADLLDRLKPFTGWVDEIALWDRPLTGTEVAIQYWAALGADADAKVERE